ncbi:MAG TPA: CAP domain-containing protein [Burkholderiaceae bacterium]|nr:CAP domain-containing protein [Burkholderiaceae bacterium]
MKPSDCRPRTALRAIAIALLSLAAPIAAAQTASAGNAAAALAQRINDFRSEARECDGTTVPAAPPLAPNDALARAQFDAGTPLQQALRSAGYLARRAQAIGVAGPGDAAGAMRLLTQRYCRTLLDPALVEIGVSRDGNAWRIVLAQPLIETELGDWRQAGQRVLQLTNDARSQPRACGDKRFDAAPPLQWNDALGQAAHAHSRDMARNNRFSHRGSDGSEVGQRATQAGYRWQRIGENIATGQGAPERVVAGWVASPGHCENLMNPQFTQMGAAFAINRDTDTVIFWTQALGTPR